MTDHANDPFCRPAPEHYPYDWLCTVTAEDRVNLVRGMDERDCERVIALPGVQRTVLRAAEARLKRLRKGHALVPSPKERRV